MHTVELSVVIPVYRSADMLGELARRLFRVLDGLGVEYEIIFVDDGSPDGSWQVLQQLQEAYPDRVVAIKLMRNYGQHNALMCAFRASRGQFVVTMDDDLQTPPEEIPMLLKAICEKDLDLVYGSYAAKKHHLFRNLGSRLVNGFYRMVFRMPVTITSFRIIRRVLLESIFSYSLNFTFVDGLLAWNTQRVGEVTVEHHPRAKGRSGYTLRKLVSLALNLFTNFSLLPLRLATVLGFFASAGGFLVALWYLIQYFFAGISVPGYASTIIAILVLGGVQLLSLGVLGEYLGRVHLNVNRKPQYTVREVVGPVSDSFACATATSRSEAEKVGVEP
jgi:undecaprenyl-phosphate 4-deoxy-4-formamido-L-arabinose transferase